MILRNENTLMWSWSYPCHLGDLESLPVVFVGCPLNQIFKLAGVVLKITLDAVSSRVHLWFGSTELSHEMPDALGATPRMPLY